MEPWHLLEMSVALLLSHCEVVSHSQTAFSFVCGLGPLFSHPHTKEKKVVWLCETNCEVHFKDNDWILSQRGYNKQLQLPSASSQRAKRGFVYWCKEPKPKTHGNNNVPTCSTNLHTHVVTFQVRKLHLDLTKQLLDLVMSFKCILDNCIHSCY